MNNSTLANIQPILDDLHAEAEANDGPILANALDAVVERDAKTESEVADILADAFIPIDRPNGHILHTLANARRPGRIVEFGTSMGVSAIYLAAALRNDEPPVITTELVASKATRAQENWARVDLADRIELRVGDAFETLANFDEPIGLLFLDGWKNMYLPMLELLEPQLVDGAMVVADDTILLAHECAPLLSYLRDPQSRYATAAIEVGDGMEIASRLAA